jgi:hypothetical protein
MVLIQGPGGRYMNDSREETADSYFQCSDSERAAFEAGIKMGTIYHQFVGIPVSSDNVETLEKAIEEGCRIQPFVESVKVQIDKSRLKTKRGEFDYISLTGEMLDVELVVKYKGAVVEAGMRHVKEMNYPLMFIKRISRP